MWVLTNHEAEGDKSLYTMTLFELNVSNLPVHRFETLHWPVPFDTDTMKQEKSDNMVRIVVTTLPDGTKKYSRKLETQKEIDEKEKLNLNLDKEKHKEERYKKRLISRFWEKVSTKDNNECWEWIGTTIKGGYGRLQYRKNKILAHRLSYIIHYGNPPSDKPYICHKCNNPSCVNPNHLYTGTQKDNMKQMFNEHRANRKQNGENNNASKKTLREVNEIRKLWLDGKYSQHTIAKMFDVSNSLINKIVNNVVWVDGKYIPIDTKKQKTERNIEIIKLYKSGKYTHQKLSEMFELSRNAITYIINQIYIKEEYM